MRTVQGPATRWIPRARTGIEHGCKYQRCGFARVILLSWSI